MKIIETKVYPYSELSEKGKQKALEKNYNINVDCNWWTFIYEDAKNIGLEIIESNWEYRPTTEGRFMNCGRETAVAILEGEYQHREECETYILAEEFLVQRGKIIEATSGNPDMDENDLEELEEDFLKKLLQRYAVMIKEEFEYRTSKEAIIETFEANDYHFEENGKMNNS